MMTTYKLLKNDKGEESVVLRNGADSIPFVPDNTDYQQFKKDIMAGGELQDADGVVMANAQEFVTKLP